MRANTKWEHRLIIYTFICQDIINLDVSAKILKRLTKWVQKAKHQGMCSLRAVE